MFPLKHFFHLTLFHASSSLPLGAIPPPGSDFFFLHLLDSCHLTCIRTVLNTYISSGVLAVHVPREQQALSWDVLQQMTEIGSPGSQSDTHMDADQGAMKIIATYSTTTEAMRLLHVLPPQLLPAIKCIDPLQGRQGSCLMSCHAWLWWTWAMHTGSWMAFELAPSSVEINV